MNIPQRGTVIRLTLGLFMLAAACGAQNNAKQTGTFEQRLSGFVAAFDALDWENFQTFFTEDATVFHPAAPNLKRTDSREEFEHAWQGVFERIRKSSGKSAPPYMTLEPKDLRVQYLTEDVALVTFHLDDGEVLGRRTIIWKRNGRVWKIVHIHASNLKEK